MSAKTSKQQAEASKKTTKAITPPAKASRPPANPPAAVEQKVRVSLLLKLAPDTWAVTEVKELEIYPEDGPDQGHTRCIEMAGLGDSSRAKKKAWRPKEVADLHDWVHSDVKAVIIHSTKSASPDLGASGLVGLRGGDVIVAGETCPTDTKQCATLMADSLDPLTVAGLRARGVDLDELAARASA